MTATYVSGDMNFMGSSDTEPHQVNASNPNVSVQDARVAEPTSGMTPMVFTVSLSAPAPSTVTVNYATANGGANPATGGASCGGSVDYITTSGTVNFMSGRRVKTISVDVCADTDMAETDETFLVDLSNLGATIADGRATGTITVANPAGATLISELRHFGPGMANNPNDEFVEIPANNAGLSADGAGGRLRAVQQLGATCADTPVLIGTIPNGTVIPARGHYLFVGTAYSLADYGGAMAAAGNATLTAEIEANRNVALFSTADVTQISSVNRLDAVGFGANTGGVCDLLREGNDAARRDAGTRHCSASTATSAELCATSCRVWAVRRRANRRTRMSTRWTSSLLTPRRSMPGLERSWGRRGRRTSPRRAGCRTPTSRWGCWTIRRLRRRCRTECATVSMTDPVTSSFGTLSIRRRVVNNTGGTVTRLRFRIVELTTFPTPPGTADLRALTSMAVVANPVGDAGTCAPTRRRAW